MSFRNRILIAVSALVVANTVIMLGITLGRAQDAFREQRRAGVQAAAGFARAELAGETETLRSALAATLTRTDAAQMSGPIPSPSMYGTMGLLGTLRLPSASRVILVP